MKAVLMSIQPKWCELIASGKKTVEVRKSKPKIETPFKVYIYATKPRHYFKISEHLAATDENLFLSNGTVKMSDGFEYWAHGIKVEYLNGKVIGEFVCDFIYHNISLDCEQSCVSVSELKEYSKRNPLYAWHISDLVIYDDPRELSEFYTEGDCDCLNCKKCAWFDKGNGYTVEDDCNLAYKAVELHKLLDNGVIVPPCKVGQICYKVWKGEILEVKVISIQYEPLPAFSYTIRFNSLGVLCLLSDGSRNEAYSWDIYLTREEAEKALAERSKQ